MRDHLYYVDAVLFNQSNIKLFNQRTPYLQRMKS